MKLEKFRVLCLAVRRNFCVQLFPSLQMIVSTLVGNYKVMRYLIIVNFCLTQFLRFSRLQKNRKIKYPKIS